jgi:hypothetical protein
MTRRGFLRNLGVLASALSVGLTVTMPQRKLKCVWTPEMAHDLEAFHLVGYKGAEFLETGFVYAPYIPFYRTHDIVVGSLPPHFARRFANLPLTKGKNLLQLD